MEPLDNSDIRPYDIVLVSAYLHRYNIYPKEDQLRAIRDAVSAADGAKAIAMKKKMRFRDVAVSGLNRRYWRAHWELDSISKLLSAPAGVTKRPAVVHDVEI